MIRYANFNYPKQDVTRDSDHEDPKIKDEVILNIFELNLQNIIKDNYTKNYRTQQLN